MLNWLGLHHLHMRKRLHRSKFKVLKYKLRKFFSRKKNQNYVEAYPHPSKFKKVFDRFIYIIGITGPLMTIPQIISIYTYKDASGVSVYTWGAYLFCAFSWVIYGIIHKEKPIIISQSLFVLLEIMIVMGIFLYS